MSHDSGKIQVVTRVALRRRLTSLILAIGFAGSFVAAAPAGQLTPTCQQDGHACAQVIESECCCQPSGVATPTPSVFAEAWSAFVSVHQHAPAYLVEVADPSVALGAFSVVSGAPERSGPPPLDLSGFSLPLLI